MNQPEPHKRPIRSFVRREGRMTRGQKRAFDCLWPAYGLNPEKPISNLHDLFGRRAPITLEIGFGMGDSLMEQAKGQPDTDFIGIEVHRPGVGHLLASLAHEGLSNVRVFCADAVEVLHNYIPDQSLKTVQIFFPDPWPKKRHHKRRLIQTNLVELLAQKLKVGGRLHLATDWENYADHIVEVMQQLPQFQNTATEGPYVARPQSRPLTKFEQRGKRLGHSVWDLVFVKRA
jgi:tRNA (guanine-N7-)-methyltransferase